MSLEQNRGRTEVLVMANHSVALTSAIRWLLHDIRNPVQALCLMTELVSAQGERSVEGNLTGVLSDFCGKFRGDLILFERLLRPLPATLGPGPIVITDSIRFVADLASMSHRVANLDISTALGVPLPAAAGIEENLDRVLLNLVLNALESRGEGAIRIRIGAEADARIVRLWVEDDGPGIPHSVRSRLFSEPVTTREDSGGRGLGLLVSRYLARQWGGDLLVADPAQGSRIDVTFPRWGRAMNGSRESRV